LPSHSRKRDARARLGERKTASLSVSLSINSSCLLSSLPVRNGESSHVGLSTGGDEGRGRGKRGTNTQPTIANTHAPLPLLPVPALPPLSPRSVAVVHLLLLLVRRRVRHGGPGGQQEEDADVKPVLWRARGEGRKRGASGKHEPGGGLGFGERRGHSASWPPRTPTPPSEAGLLPRAPHARTGRGNQESDGSAPSHPNPLPLIFFSLSLPTSLSLTSENLRASLAGASFHSPPMTVCWKGDRV
jgi:hypothetical protein